MQSLTFSFKKKVSISSEEEEEEEDDDDDDDDDEPCLSEFKDANDVHKFFC